MVSSTPDPDASRHPDSFWPPGQRIVGLRPPVEIEGWTLAVRTDSRTGRQILQVYRRHPEGRGARNRRPSGGFLRNTMGFIGRIGSVFFPPSFDEDRFQTEDVWAVAGELREDMRRVLRQDGSDLQKSA
jgi:hypothetical protein